MTLVLGACLFLPSLASASDLHLDVEAGTELPIAVGVNVALELPHNLRVSTGLGYLPQSYVALINTVVEGFPNTYDAATGELIEETLQDSLIWRTHVGWRMPSGFYGDVGYGLATLGGGTSTEALLSALIPDAQAPGITSASYAVGSTLHMLDAEVGWKRVFANNMTFRAAVGIAATVAASATVDSESEPDRPAARRLVDQFEAATETYLVETYTDYVITPVFTMAVGYRLF